MGNNLFFVPPKIITRVGGIQCSFTPTAHGMWVSLTGDLPFVIGAPYPPLSLMLLVLFDRFLVPSGFYSGLGRWLLLAARLTGRERFLKRWLKTR